MPELDLNFLCRTLTGAVHGDSYVFERRPERIVGAEAMRAIEENRLTLVRERTGEDRRRLLEEGRGWPVVGETMLGLARLQHPGGASRMRWSAECLVT